MAVTRSSIAWTSVFLDCKSRIFNDGFGHLLLDGHKMLGDERLDKGENHNGRRGINKEVIDLVNKRNWPPGFLTRIRI